MNNKIFKIVSKKILISLVLLSPLLGNSQGPIKSEELIKNWPITNYYNHDSLNIGYWFEAPFDLDITGANYPSIDTFGGSYAIDIHKVTASQGINFMGDESTTITDYELKKQLTGQTSAATFTAIPFSQGENIAVTGYWNPDTSPDTKCPAGANECHTINWRNTETASLDGTSVTLYGLNHHRTTDSQWDGDTSYRAFIQLEIAAQSSDTGDATYSISGTNAAGSTLTASVSIDDPDGNGSVTSYTWESSSDGSTGWTTISSGTESTYTLTSDEEGKSIRVTVAYTDGSSTSESVTASSVSISQLHTEWVQPYAAMQNFGLKSIHNNRDLVLAKAGECNNSGWVIGDSDYCIYTNANNMVSYVNGDSTKGSYGSAVFNSSLNLEKTLNDKWKAGIAYGQGSANLYNFNFSGTTANLDSSNNHYSVYGVKKVNDIFTLKGMVGGSVFDYKGKRNYSSTAATSAYETDGYTAEINGIWDIKKTIKNMKTPIRLRPSFGVAYAAHTQDGFSESGSGDLITIDANQTESLLFKTGISIDKQIPMEGGKWLLVPSLALNYEMDTYAGSSNRDIKGGLTESSTAHTSVEAKTFGQHNGSLELGADFVLTKDLMFNLKAEYGLATNGDEHSYGGGFRWQF